MPQIGDSIGANSAAETARWATSRQSWYTVALLSLLYVMSLIDRNILALLAQPVAQSLGLDDRQMALLLGLGFALLYAIGGLFLGHFVDTRNRRIVATVGILLWSAATILSAFATTFWSMLLLRSGVALGEAVLMPTTISLIADLFPPKARGLPVAMFTSVGSFMTIGSYAAGAAAIDLASTASPILGISVWQTTLVIVGLPGLVLALLFAITATVPQRLHKGGDAASTVSMTAVLSHIKNRIRFLGPLLSLTGINCIYSLAIVTWLPTVLIREHHMTAANAGYLIGVIGVPAGVGGNFFWQWVAGRMQHRDPARGLLRPLVVAALLTAPCYAAGLLAHSANMKVMAFGCGLFLSTAFNLITPLAVQSYTSPHMRARIVSVNFLIIAVLGFGLGPLAAVEIGALLSSGVEGLRYGLIALSLLTWPVVVVVTLATVRNADAPMEQ
ncbi:MAG: MFS transporter [Novosphingobium sp.]